jgi:hypothetical protein
MVDDKKETKLETIGKQLTRRIGKFTIPDSFILSEYDFLFKIMARCIIIRAEHLLYRQEIEYVAYSWDFDEIHLGDEPPRYVWYIEEETGNVGSYQRDPTAGGCLTEEQSDKFIKTLIDLDSQIKKEAKQ